MDWPLDYIPYRWEWYLQPNTRAFRSPLTRTRQVLAGQGPMWVGTGSWHFKTHLKERRFEAFLDKLKGQVIPVNVWDFDSSLPLGPMLDLSSIGRTYFTTPGSPGGRSGFRTPFSPPVITYFTGGAAGVSVYLSWPAGAEEVMVRGFPQGSTPLYAGDYVQLGRFAYRLTEDATADGRNRARLYLNRPLVERITDASAVVTTRARTPMQLLDDDQTRRSRTVGQPREYTVSLVEVLNLT